VNLKKLLWVGAFIAVMVTFIFAVTTWPSLLLGLSTIGTTVFLFWLEGKIGATKVAVFSCLLLVLLVIVGVIFFGPPPPFLSFIMSILVAFFRALILAIFIVLGWICWKKAFYS
jgi:hypothetical protein